MNPPPNRTRRLTLERVVGRVAGRKSRFHTLRGDRLPTAELLRLPLALAQRASGRIPKKPWIAPSAVDWLDSVMTRQWAVFEFGSGVSTEWYARRAGSIMSLEDDPAWCIRVRSQLQLCGVSNYDVVQADLSHFPSMIATQPNDVFDLVVVDSNETHGMSRVDCVAAAQHAVKPGRYLLLDNSDRPEYYGADALLAGWPVERFIGIKSYPSVAVETSIYRRPLRAPGVGETAPS